MQTLRLLERISPKSNIRVTSMHTETHTYDLIQSITLALALALTHGPTRTHNWS
jgi:hypothetical protein